MRIQRALALIASLGGVLLSACTLVPVERVTVDRMEYGEVVAESWKRQTLLNVVRLRHADAPVFLEVSAIINSYSLAQKGTLSAALLNGSAPNTLSLGAEGTWSNTPTVTYQPLMGDRFTKSLLTPVPPASVFLLLQGGWQPDLVLRTVVNSINGLRNSSSGDPADARFDELIAALSRIQRSGGLGIRVEARPDGSAVVIGLPRSAVDESTLRDAARVGELLGLRPGVRDFTVTYGLFPRGPDEVAMLSRSMIEIMLQLGAGIEFPEATPTAMPLRRSQPEALQNTLVRIHSGDKAPDDAYAAVRYKGRTYWLDDRDINSKRTFTFLLILFSLAETGQGPNAPVVTVPSR